MAGIGEALRDAREGRGLTITQASQDTRISAHFLQALEDEAFEELPAPVYVRGFLRSYANYLQLDAQAIIDELNADQASPLSGPDAFIQGPPGEDPGRDPFGPSRTAAGRTPGPVEEHRGTFPPAVAIPVARQRQARHGIAASGEAAYSEGTTGLRVLAILGAVAMGLLVLSVTAMALRGGDGNSPSAGLRGDDEPGGTQTVIEVGPRTPTPSASETPDGTLGAEGGGTATPDGTTTPGSETSTATTGPGTPTATTAAPATATSPATPTATPRPPTATPVPPTATPIPPTPTPIVHPLGFQECAGGTWSFAGCGGLDFRVVCAPNGWFLDVGPAFPNPGWPVVVVDEAKFTQSEGGGYPAITTACG